jgi:CubicO group peptidase (beta-lactamase class C family)
LPYREYVKKHIFEKVGMASSDFLRLDRVNHNLAEGSDPIHDEPVNLVGWKKNIYSFPPVGSPDSGAHVTAGDLDRFLRAVLAGDLLSPELTESLTTPQVYYRDTKRGRLMFSYVLEFLLDQSGQVIYFQKDGVNAGVSAIIRHFPASDINVILLSNMEQGVWKPVWEIHELVMAGAFAGM